MARILFVMDRQMLAEELLTQLTAQPGFEAAAEYCYSSVLAAADQFRPDIVVMEIPERPVPSPDQCLCLCDTLKEAHPACKLVILCPEETAASRATIHAMRCGRINDFIYYDATIHYLLSKLKAL